MLTIISHRNARFQASTPEMISLLTMKFRVVTSSGIFGRAYAHKINDSAKNSFSFYMLKKCKPFKVDIFTKTVSENVVHDKCDKECFIQ